MANENVKKFEELLRGSEELQAKLKGLLAAFDGDKSDEEALFEATIAKLAEEAGLPFGFDEAKDCAIAEGAISDEELDAVAGGKGFCIIIGGADDVEIECTNEGGYSCAYVGITI